MSSIDFTLNYSLLLILHLFVNLVVFIICIRRLDRMQKVLFRVKAQYVLLTVASVANGFSPILFKQWPTVISIFYAGCVLFMLASDSFQWRKGPPDAALSDHAPLEPHNAD